MRNMSDSPRPARCSRPRANARSAAVVILRLRGSPGTSSTVWPSCSASDASSVRVGALLAVRDGAGEHVATEGLRRLREEDRLARQRPLHRGHALRPHGRQRLAELSADPAGLGDVGQLHRVARRQRGNRGAGLRRGLNRALDRRAVDERPRRVVDDDDIGVGRRRRRTHWRPSPAAAARLRRRARGRRRAADTSGGVGRVRRWQRDDDFSRSPGTGNSASTLRSRIARPPSSRNCFGTAVPRRVPWPPAATMAATRMHRRRKLYDVAPAAHRRRRSSTNRAAVRSSTRGQLGQSQARPARRRRTAPSRVASVTIVRAESEVGLPNGPRCIGQRQAAADVHDVLADAVVLLAVGAEAQLDRRLDAGDGRTGRTAAGTRASTSCRCRRAC